MQNLKFTPTNLVGELIFSYNGVQVSKHKDGYIVADQSRAFVEPEHPPLNFFVLKAMLDETIPLDSFSYFQMTKKAGVLLDGGRTKILKIAKPLDADIENEEIYENDRAIAFSDWYQRNATQEEMQLMGY